MVPGSVSARRLTQHIDLVKVLKRKTFSSLPLPFFDSPVISGGRLCGLHPGVRGRGDAAAGAVQVCNGDGAEVPHKPVSAAGEALCKPVSAAAGEEVPHKPVRVSQSQRFRSGLKVRSESLLRCRQLQLPGEGPCRRHDGAGAHSLYLLRERTLRVCIQS